MGSLDETQSHLCAAHDRGYLNKTEFAELYREGTTIRKLTVGFIRDDHAPRRSKNDGADRRAGRVACGKSTNG